MVRVDIERCKQDLLSVGSYTIEQISCPYDFADNWEISMQNIYSKFKDKIKCRQRIMTMVYAYYIGELINLSVTPREKWLEFVELKQIKREHHYYLGITRVYSLFKSNVEQIYRTSYLSYRKLLDMRATEHRELVNYHQTVNELSFDEL
jgi:hypothetical protein